MKLYNPPTGKDISLEDFTFVVDTYKMVKKEDAKYLMEQFPFLINMSSHKRKPSYCEVVSVKPKRHRKLRRLFLKLRRWVTGEAKG